MKAVRKIRRLKRGRLSGLVEMRCSRYAVQFREAAELWYDAKLNKQAFLSGYQHYSVLHALVWGHARPIGLDGC